LFRMRDLRNALFKLVCKCSQQRVHPLNGWTFEEVLRTKNQ
jgi:hypothetical protein